MEECTLVAGGGIFNAVDIAVRREDGGVQLSQSVAENPAQLDGAAFAFVDCAL